MSGIWDAVHQRYSASKPLPVIPVHLAKGDQHEQQAAEVLGMERLHPLAGALLDVLRNDSDILEDQLLHKEIAVQVLK